MMLSLVVARFTAGAGADIARRSGATVLAQGHFQCFRHDRLASPYVPFGRNLSSSTTTATESSDTFAQIERLVGQEKVSHQQHRQPGGSYEGENTWIEVFPACSHEVAGIMAICNETRTPVTPVGGGTQFIGGNTLPTGTVGINLSRNMDQVLGVEDLHVHVEAGATLNHKLPAYAHKWFPIDWHAGTDNTIGGRVAMNTVSSYSVGYGQLKSSVMNMEVVLPSGEIIHTGGPKRNCAKSSAGLNMTDLFIGSGGLLGIITELTLKYRAPLSDIRRYLVPVSSFSSAITVARDIMMCGIPIARMVAIDATTKEKHLNRNRNLHDTGSFSLPTSQGGDGALLLVDLHGYVPRDLGASIELLEQVLEMNNALSTCVVEEGIASVNDSSSGSGAALSESMASRAFVADATHNTHVWTSEWCVPLSGLEQLYDHIQGHIASQRVEAGVLGYLGSGHLRIHAEVDISDEASTSSVDELNRSTTALAKELGGKALRSDSKTPRQMSDLEMRLKGTFDPHNILRPMHTHCAS